MGTDGKQKKLLLVDGYSLVFRAFFAMPGHLRRADGQPVQAVLGFLNMLLRLLEDEEPTHVAVAFDAPGPTFRHEAYEEYKAHRDKTPDDLRSQFPIVREVLDALNVPVVEQTGYEADDVIGTLARDGGGKAKVVIVSGDRDLLQLVDRNVVARITRRGITDLHTYDLDRIKEEYGVEPRQLIDVKALMGDTSDNIPGVPGVGEKTALRLIKEYGDAEKVLADAANIRGPKLSQSLSENAQLVRDSRLLTAIVTDVPLGVTFDDLARAEPHGARAFRVLTDLGFRSLIGRLGLTEADDGEDGTGAAGAASAGEGAGDDGGPDYRLWKGGGVPAELKEALAAADEAVFLYRFAARDPLPRRDALGPMAIALEGEGKGIWVLLPHPSGGTPAPDPESEAAGDSGPEAASGSESGAAPDPEAAVLEVAAAALQRAAAGEMTLVIHDLKPLLSRMYHRGGGGEQAPLAPGRAGHQGGDGARYDFSRKSGYGTAGGGDGGNDAGGAPGSIGARLPGRHEDPRKMPVFDTALAGYLLDPGRSTYRVADLLRQYTGQEHPDPEDLLSGPPPRRRRGQIPLPVYASLSEETLAQSMARQAASMLGLRDAMAAELLKWGLGPLFRDVESPLTDVLARMEHRGIQVDASVLDELGAVFDERIARLAGEIHGMAGREFNINSPKQLSEVLFEDLGLPVIKKTKTGYSTDAEVLETLSAQHPIAEKILEHRSLAKLKGTYVQGLADVIDPSDGRIHTTFQQTVAATGRLASTDPNLQNIPIRDEPGRQLRRAFQAGTGRRLVAADYSQIELRILAHLSGDEALVEAFRHGEDIHRSTASRVFDTPLEDVTGAQRSSAKAVNFGIIYGISDFGLGRQLGIERSEAKKYIDAYFERFPGVAEFIDGQVSFAREHGFVGTLFGRIRLLPDINNRIHHRRAFAERTAMNTPIQGSAADIIKLAMVRVEQRLRAEGMEARLLLQIHDELIVEAPAGEVDGVARLLKEEMGGCVALDVPLVVDVSAGPDWHHMEDI